jgi:hypothetical protein
VDTAFTGAGSARFCELLRSFESSSKSAPAIGDPSALRDAFRTAESSVKQAVALAPAEIKPDVTRLSSVYSEFLAALDTVNFDFSKMSPATVASLASQGTRDAATRVEAYTRTICKVGG